jgi:hypothetical protein
MGENQGFMGNILSGKLMGELDLGVLMGVLDAGQSK